ncbi:Lytic transglycosylase catalytic [Bacteroides coprosuis DSM 18011]|uniref:Lytic transglycosylase catalytic n=1 Tax=Bacteroides coprosuis DSM 18011 TaxID=679937 RepID=F3ZSN9_9BACE|nr:lytic transglycosylase domain-containing protein [Bacteroides coprosuis]EGJ70913.1 Lytic transglycosylase catalytic [Bacteroides coprosuis DSM 18011]HJD91102.1 transglycosylase SLT domain-containing protein [Bacteroides coprosuis]
MKKVIVSVFIFISLFMTVTSKAQIQNQTIDEDIEIPETMIWSIDSLLNDWKTQKYLDLQKDCQTAKDNPFFPDSIYNHRLSRIPSIMEMPYNSVVRSFIDLYSVRLRQQVAIMLSSTNFYIPIFEEALDAYNLPLELKYLPIIESALNPTAVSRAGATGLWQFMLSTGKEYGLETNSLVDDRRDPIKATWSAARYLKDLYEIYHDWNLVIAAYNCGPGNINKAIRRAGGESDYWEIYNYLPKETRGYVPAFIAANYIMTYYCDHNICPIESTLPVVSDTVIVNKEIHFDQISSICNIDKEELRSLNPQYKRDIIPGNTKPYALRLPHYTIPTYIENQDSIYNYKRDEYFTNRKKVEAKQKPKAPTSRTTYYKIKNGDTLSTIARKHGVSVSKLKQWNGLKNNNIRAGKTLKIIK